MTLMKKNGVFFPEFPKLFDDFLTRDFFDWGTGNFSNTNTNLPAVNIVETANNFVVEMAAPGMTKQDFEVELKDDLLTITSQKQVQNELGEGERYTRREFSYQAFQRSFRLPKNVVEDSNIAAKYENGILQLLIPKKEEAKALPPRKIAIQ
jgi:HSP20 family protein